MKESAQCSSYNDGAGGHDGDDDNRGGHDGHDDDDDDDGHDEDDAGGGGGGYDPIDEFSREKNLITLQSFIMKMLVIKLKN